MGHSKDKPRAWSKLEFKIVREMYPEEGLEEIAAVLGRSQHSVRSKAHALRLRKKSGFGGHWRFSAEEDRKLRDIYPHISAAAAAAQMGRTLGSINCRAQQLGLKKTQIYLDSPAACRLRRGDNVGAAFRFKKGQAPPNKGLRRPGWAPGRMASTQFKKGHASINTMPIWSFRWCDGYLLLKTGANTPKPIAGWEYVHKLIWEHWNGPLPSWRVARLWWKDGDHGNCSLSNLELVSAKEHMARTTVHNLPPQLKQVIQLTGALKRKIRNLEGKHNGEEHTGGSPQSSIRDSREPQRPREEDRRHGAGQSEACL